MTNVNNKNLWGQTDLHFAAIKRSFKNIQTLLCTPGVDINATDVNGYNALHCCFSSNGISDLKYLQKTMNGLINAGIEINAQTKFGFSVLHLASTQEDNTPLLKFLLQNYPDIDLNLKTKMGDNFLHIYTVTEIFEEVIELFKGEIISLPKLRELLNHRNVLGQTPWSLMIDTRNIIPKAMEVLLSYGISVNLTDHLRNTIMHRIAGQSVLSNMCKILEILIDNGSHIHTRNIFGDTPASVLFLEDVLDVFIKHEMQFNTTDRWGRTPLFSIMKQHPIPDVLRKLIVMGKVDVNARDAYGTTPLHCAAYDNYPEQVELLLEYGADKEATDNLNDNPLDTAKRHNSFLCLGILQDSVEVLYSREKAFEEIMIDMPKKIFSSGMTSANDIKTMLGIPMELEKFTNQLLMQYFTRTPEHAEEIVNVRHEVTTLVENLCRHVAEYDYRFKISVFPTGSMAEGTKIGRPDEFDFVLCLDRVSEACIIEETKESEETGYACIKFIERPVEEDYLPFSDEEGYFVAFPFLQYLSRYIKRALNERGVWENGNLYYRFEDKMYAIQGKPVFSFNVYWIGSVYKTIKISIDLVPGIYRPGWWPKKFLDNLPLKNERITQAGCFLILQTQSNEFNRDGSAVFMDDSIINTCDPGNKNPHEKRMLRISATPAEICLMKSIPDIYRRAYALAKILRSREFCPDIEIDMIHTNFGRAQEDFRERKCNEIVKPSAQIKSYMLKNCIFYIAMEDMQMHTDHHQGEKAFPIVVRMYEFLLESFKKRFMRPYFLPYSDVFEFEKKDPMSSIKYYKLRLRRDLSTKLILGILSQKIPEIKIDSTEILKGIYGGL